MLLLIRFLTGHKVMSAALLLHARSLCSTIVSLGETSFHFRASFPRILFILVSFVHSMVSLVHFESLK